MPAPRRYIVGRDDQIIIARKFVQSDTGEFILNIYGPGGIGKTEVCALLAKFFKAQHWVHSLIQLDGADLTFDRVLYMIRTDLFARDNVPPKLSKFFTEFDRRVSEYLIIKEVIGKEGGIGSLFDSLGDVVPDALTKAVASVGKLVADEIRLHFRNRYALQKYLNGAERWITEAFIEGISQVRTHIRRPIILIFDTYEKATHLDEWMNNIFVRLLPDGLFMIICGRDRLQNVGFHWMTYSQQIWSHELVELNREAVLEFYRHYGLHDLSLLEETYHFTGGYPLCMTLAVDLARESGWHRIAGFQKQVDRYEVARQLLGQLLQQEGVAEVRQFLEQGVVTLWFDIEAIAYLLDVPSAQAEDIFHRISRFSFTSKTDFGLKFHDRVREILLERLIYTDRDLYEHLLRKWREYYKTKVADEWPGTLRA